MRITIQAGLAGLLTVGLLAGCDTLECGTGTHREGDRCVPNVQVACGAGTTFQDGRCVAPDAPDLGPTPDFGPGLSCGAGTHEEDGVCLPDEVVTPPDRGVPADMGVDPDDGVPQDASPDMATPDMDVEPPPRCPPELTPGAPPADCGRLPPGSYCVVGVAVDFVTGCALPADQGLGAVVIDPVAVASGATPEEAARGQAAIGPNGTFAIACAGESTQLALVIDEAPQVPVNTWTRSVSGISAAQPTPGQIFRMTAFATTQAVQATWNAALGLGERGLEQGGFLVGRVYARRDGGLVPAADARVRMRMTADALDCAADRPCLRFFDDDPALTGFQAEGAGATGQSGGFLMQLRGPVPVLQDQFYIDRQDATYAPLPAGASRGSGFHTAFVPM